jgi:hypothetical protein
MGFVKDKIEPCPFDMYTNPTWLEKGIPLNLAGALNAVLSGEKTGKLSFEYKVELAGELNAETGEKEDGEILLYPSMLEKTIKASADLLILVPLKFEALGSENQDTVKIDIPAGLGNSDLFGRTENDNGYFDYIKFLGFDITSKNVLGIKAGEIYLENEKNSTDRPFEPQPIFNLAGGGSSLFLDEELLKANNPFVPKLSIRFKPGDIVEIDRDFSISLESITVRVGGEFPFDTGL